MNKGGALTWRTEARYSAWSAISFSRPFSVLSSAMVLCSWQKQTFRHSKLLHGSICSKRLRFRSKLWELINQDYANPPSIRLWHPPAHSLWVSPLVLFFFPRQGLSSSSPEQVLVPSVPTLPPPLFLVSRGSRFCIILLNCNQNLPTRKQLLEVMYGKMKAVHIG